MNGLFSLAASSEAKAGCLHQVLRFRCAISPDMLATAVKDGSILLIEENEFIDQYAKRDDADAAAAWRKLRVREPDNASSHSRPWKRELQWIEKCNIKMLQDGLAIEYDGKIEVATDEDEYNAAEHAASAVMRVKRKVYVPSAERQNDEYHEHHQDSKLVVDEIELLSKDGKLVPDSWRKLYATATFEFSFPSSMTNITPTIPACFEELVAKAIYPVRSKLAEFMFRYDAAAYERMQQAAAGTVLDLPYKEAIFDPVIHIEAINERLDLEQPLESVLADQEVKKQLLDEILTDPQLESRYLKYRDKRVAESAQKVKKLICSGEFVPSYGKRIKNYFGSHFHEDSASDEDTTNSNDDE